MSVQTNQFLMYGIKMNHEEKKKMLESINMSDDLFYETFCEFDKWDGKVAYPEGIFCCCDYEGDIYILGKCIEVSADGEYIANQPIDILQCLDSSEIESLKADLINNFKLPELPAMSYYLATIYS